jgi:hypothetical protein
MMIRAATPLPETRKREADVGWHVAVHAEQLAHQTWIPTRSLPTIFFNYRYRTSYHPSPASTIRKVASTP